MRLLLLLAVALSLSIPMHAQYTLHQVDGDRTMELELDGDVRIDLSLNGPSFVEGFRQLRGRVAPPRRDLMQIVWETEHKEYTLNTGMRKHEDFDYRGIPELVPMSLALEEMQAIHYRGRRAEKWHTVGQGLTFLGAVTALIAAPLVSANFGDKTFNRDRYYQWAGTGLAVGGIGLTLMLTHRYKIFVISPDSRHANDKRPLWRL